MNIPRFPASFNGTGDLFAALFLAWYTKSNENLQYSFDATVSTLNVILERTMAFRAKSELFVRFLLSIFCLGFIL